MSGQDGGMIDNGTMLWGIDHFHRDELGAEGQDVQFCPQRCELLHHLRDGLALQPPSGKLKYGDSVLFCLGSCWHKECEGPTLYKNL